MEFQETANEFPEVFKARNAFNSGRTLDLNFRLQQLSRVEEMLNDEDCRQMICEAMHKDLRKSTYESILVEIVGVKLELQAVLNNFKESTKSEKMPRNLLTFKDVSLIQKQPLGVILIVSPWNYPIYLTLTPLIGAIAGGNCVIMKPSEMSSHSSVVISKLITKYLDNSCYHVVLGGPERIQKLLTYRFDHIFFTGSSRTGKLVLKAAQQNLTPVTLELGGKSPVYIDDTADLEMTFKRVLWGKMINVGQTCIAPDYILCNNKVQKSFVDYARKILQDFYGNNIKDNPDVSRIINSTHFSRLKKLLNETRGRIAIGGEMDEKDLYIAPTIVIDVPGNDSLMSDELFGPILPIVHVNSPEEAIEFINARERPLALYIFSKNENTVQHMLDSTYSGTACVNDVIFQVSDPRLPFGGTGNSGMGQYHGKYSMDTFTFKRAVLKRELNYLSEKCTGFRYPPLSMRKLKAFEKSLMFKDRLELQFTPLMTHAFAAVIGYFICQILSFFV